MEAAKIDQNHQIYAFVLIGLRTGMRKSEIVSIRREHVDLDARTIFVPSAKSGPRTQPMSADLASFLLEYIGTLPEDTPWLFPSPDARHGHTVDVRKAFVRSVKAAGLDPKQVVRHTLRHTAITHLVQAGVDLPTVKRISGHKRWSNVMRTSRARISRRPWIGWTIGIAARRSLREPSIPCSCCRDYTETTQKPARRETPHDPRLAINGLLSDT